MVDQVGISVFRRLVEDTLVLQSQRADEELVWRQTRGIENNTARSIQVFVAPLVRSEVYDQLMQRREILGILRDRNR
jgi:hypothetical protein